MFFPVFFIFKHSYRIPESIFREYVYRFVINKYFTYFVAVVIVLNIIILCMAYTGMPPAYKLSLDILNTIFIGVFVVEMILKMIALGFVGYFTDGWLVLDFLIVIGSVADVIVTFVLAGQQSVSISIVRVLRLFALLKLMRVRDEDFRKKKKKKKKSNQIKSNQIKISDFFLSS